MFITKGLAFLLPKKVAKFLLPKNYEFSKRQGLKEPIEQLESTRSIEGSSFYDKEDSIADLMQDLNINIPIKPVLANNGRVSFEKKIMFRSSRNINSSLPRYKKLNGIENIKRKISLFDPVGAIKPEPENKAASENCSQIGSGGCDIKNQKLETSSLKGCEVENLKEDEEESPEILSLGPKKVSNISKMSSLSQFGMDKRRTRVIISSRWKDAMKLMPGRIDHKWDNFEVYNKKKKLDVN